MSDDEEIERKIAELEGWVFRDGFDACWLHHEHGARVANWGMPYTTDWAWCGPLVAKYNVQLSGGAQSDADAGYWSAYCLEWRQGHWCPMPEPDASETTPQRAICRAIIAARTV